MRDPTVFYWWRAPDNEIASEIIFWMAVALLLALFGLATLGTL